MDLIQLICTPFSYIVSAVNSWTGSYLLALLAFTLVMKFVLFPLSIKQQKNSVRQAKLRPREEAIRAKYAGRNDKKTQQKMQQEIMEMYQEEKFSPLSGCLPLLLQLPLLIILYSIVRQPLMYTARYNNAEIDALRSTMAITEYYDARAELDGAKGGDFYLERTDRGEYRFLDPKTGKMNRVLVEETEGQEIFVFYEEGKDGKFKKEALYFVKGSYTQTEKGAEKAFGGIPAYPFDKNGLRLEESAMISPLRDNAALWAQNGEKPAYNYTEVYALFAEDDASCRSKADLKLLETLPNFELFDGAIDLGHVPVFTEMNWLLVIPLLTFITSYGSQWLTRKFTYQPQTADTQSSMRMMNVIMPLMSVWISFMVPAALAVYWIMQNLITPLQQIVLAKCWPVPKYSEEELKKLKNEYVAKQKGRVDKKSIPAPKRRSLVYDDDEDEEETPAPAPKKTKEPTEESPIGKADLK